MTVSVPMWLNRNVPPMVIVLVLRSVMLAPALKPPAVPAQLHLIVSATDFATTASAPTHALLTTRVRMVRFVMLNSCV